MIICNNVPQLDLHGLDKEYSRILINDFIQDNYKLKNKIILIIHGIGKGILQKETHKVLKRNKYVENYYLDNFNVGQTVVILKI